MSHESKAPSARTSATKSPVGTAMFGTVVYISNAESKRVFVFRESPKVDSLDLIQEIDIPGIDGPSPFSAPLAVSPDKRFLYAVLRKPPFPISTYAISPDDGSLELIDTVHLHDSICYLSVDRTGRFLLSASYFGGNVAINQIDVDGKIQLNTRRIIPTGQKTHCIIIDNANRYAYSAALDDDRILQFRFDENLGKLEPNTPDAVRLSVGSGPRHLTLGPNGKFLYVIMEYSAAIAVLSVDAQSGTLSLQQTVDLLPPGTFPGVAEAADIHLTPDGRFLFGSERISNTITSFRVDAESGMLAKIESFGTEREPRSFAIDPGGEHLLVAGQASNSLGIYRIDQSSGHAQLIGNRQLGGSPTWVEVVAFPESMAPRQSHGTISRKV